MAITLDGTAGITSPSPLKLTNVTLSSPAVAGQLEYDGGELYFTPLDTQRGLIPGMQYFRLNSGVVGANVNTAQSILGVGVTLSSNTVYYFESFYALSKTAGVTSHTVSSLFGGTASINNIGYYASNQGDNSGFTTVPLGGTITQQYIQTASATVMTGAIAVATTFRIYSLRGTVSINAGGTFIPQYQLSAAPGGAYTTQIGSYFLIYPIGAAGSNTNIGTWA